MSNILTITAAVTTVNNGDPIKLNTTPLAGGHGREAKVHVPTRPLTSTVLLQGHGETANGNQAAPAADSAGWATIATIEDDTAQLFELADLPAWIRYRTSALDADGPNVIITIEGVQ